MGEEKKTKKMADYWDEHADAEEPVEDVMDFVRRMVTGQLPSHWHLDDFADLSMAPAHVRAMFAMLSGNSQRKTTAWFIELIEENDGFPVQPDDQCAICIEALDEYDYLKIKAVHEGKAYGCGHIFHKKCIRQWLEKASACPLCMHQLPVDDETAELDQIEARYRELQLESEDRQKRADSFSSSMFG